MSHPTIEFRFAFNIPSTNTDAEHVLNVTRTDSNFEWSFRKLEPEATIMYLDEESVYTNLRKLFDLLYWDSNPYSHFRVIFPGFPSAYITMNNARSALPFIEELMSTVFNSHPVTISLEDAAEEVEEEDDESDESDGDSVNESLDDDMPGLIPLSRYIDDDDMMPPLIPLSCMYCPCTPKRCCSNPAFPSAPPRIRRVQNEIIDNNGPCNNTRASKQRKLNDSTSVATHMYFD